MDLNEHILNEIDSRFDGNLPFSVVSKSVNKGFVFTDYGQLETNVYFLKEGIVQVEVDSNDELKILDFFFQNNFFSSLSSFLTNSSSDVCIKSVMDCEVQIIDLSELYRSCEHSLIANKLARIEIEKLFLRRVLREKQLLTQNAGERYFSLISRYPEVIKHIPLKDVAKYLGITPESLSRIRKNRFS